MKARAEKKLERSKYLHSKFVPGLSPYRRSLVNCAILILGFSRLIDFQLCSCLCQNKTDLVLIVEEFGTYTQREEAKISRSIPDF